jgi:putative hydroxymethylpyrimidine transport system substrate-binding protein
MSIAPFAQWPRQREVDEHRARLAVLAAVLGIAASLVAYAIAPGVGHVVKHAEVSVRHAVTHAVDKVFPSRGQPVAAPLARLTHATLILDYVPNAVHAGIYRALAAGYYRKLNIDLKVIQPASTSETLKLIDAGRADFGIADGIDVADLIAAGGDAKAIMAISQRPLGGLIALASEKLTSARELQGREVGITGVPSDTAVLDTEVRHAGGNPQRVKVVTVGFNGAAALASGRLAAFTGYWPADGVQLEVAGHPITVFKLDDNGGPAYPGLVVFSTRSRLAADPDLARDFVAATVHGYDDTISEPSRSLADLLRLNPGMPSKFTNASLHAYLPLFTADGVPFGTLQASGITALSSWMVANHLIKSPITPARFATNEFLPSG